MNKFERIRYPDGQISAKWKEGFITGDPITERINSYEDLFYVRSMADAVPNGLSKGMKLFIPCMFGQRSDRRFEKFQSFDLKLITDIINECKFSEVQIFDPHSDVTLALIDNSVKVSPLEYVRQAVNDIVERQLLTEGHYGIGDLLLVSPDAGAFKKVFEFGKEMNLPVMGAMKHRNKDGHVDLMFTHDVEEKVCLIVDDLCDGGYTFLVLAEELRKHKAAKVYLYVSHGLFSKGFEKLNEKIDHIYTTNSVSDLDPESVFLMKFEDNAHAGIALGDFVTQYKII